MKNRQNNFLIGCIVTSLIIIIFVQICGYILDPKSSQTCFDAIKAFQILDENSQEVIVYGSSHAWKGCDTRILTEEFGIEAYNYACNWQAINTTLLFVDDSLRTQKPKVACVEVGLVDGIEKNTDMDGQIYYTKAIKNSAGKKQYLRRCFGNDISKYIPYYFPLVMFHDNWNAITSENFQSPNPEVFVENRGYRPNNYVYPCIDPNYEGFNQQELSEDSLHYLDEIITLCNSNGIKVLFFTVPYSDVYCYGDAMAKYSEDNGCEYIDFFEHAEDINFNWKTDLQDRNHLNEAGAAKIARYLGAFLVDNYSL